MGKFHLTMSVRICVSSIFEIAGNTGNHTIRKDLEIHRNGAGRGKIISVDVLPVELAWGNVLDPDSLPSTILRYCLLRPGLSFSGDAQVFFSRWAKSDFPMQNARGHIFRFYLRTRFR